MDPNEVERLYRQAVEEQPKPPWFRWLITFLIADERLDEAWSEWVLANEAFGPEPPDYVCFGLRLHVARSFLYRGELEHTDSVLRAVPTELLSDERFAVIKERLAALREARELRAGSLSKAGLVAAPEAAAGERPDPLACGKGMHCLRRRCRA